MKNTKLMSIICVIFVILLVGTTCNAISATLDNRVLSEELAKRTTELTSVQNTLNDTDSLLAEAQTALSVTTARVDSIQTELDAAYTELSFANSIIEAVDGEKYSVDMAVSERELAMLAKTVWGEARGCSKLEQSAVVWCVLNRVDDGQGTIAQVITAPRQFHGYSSKHPVTPEILELVRDVVTRWLIEKYTCGDVGRTLPSNYLFFSSDSTGIGNIFRTAWRGPFEVWDWSCWNPYE